MSSGVSFEIKDVCCALFPIDSRYNYIESIQNIVMKLCETFLVCMQYMGDIILKLCDATICSQTVKKEFTFH